MATYHFHLGHISRGKGQSAVSASAYRASERLYDDYYGEVADYTAKGGVVYTEIMTPDFVPESFHDRATLWSTVESVEKHPKAQLAYSFDIALMTEFSQEENIELAKRFVSENPVSKGMIADLAVHYKETDGHANPHFHVMCPIRPMNEDGSWGNKQRREYLLDENGENILDENGKKVFNAVPTTDWNLPQTLEDWRKKWAEMVNEEYEKRKMNERIDHRSYAEQGIEKIPQIHEGPHVRKLEAQGIKTDKGNFNRLIQRINEEISELSQMIKALIEAIAEIVEEIKTMPPEEKTVSLGECLNGYFREREEVARSYAYGRDKASSANLKAHSEVLIYLSEHKIRTLDTLGEHLSEKQSELSTLGEACNKKSQRIKEIKEILKYDKWYEEGQKIMQNIEGQKFKRKKEELKQSHSAEIKKYYVARRILTEKGVLGRYDRNDMQEVLSKMEMDYEKMYRKYKTISKDIYHLRKIYSYSQEAILHEKNRGIQKGEMSR